MDSLIKKCPMCGHVCEMKLSEEQMDKFHEYNRGGSYIQELFPELNKVEREFIKTGYCPGCQEEIFGDGETYKITWRNKYGN